MPHITVAIPVYNRAHLVGRTIESVLAQDFSDYDVVVVDDASTDGAAEIVRTFCKRDPRIRLHINPRNLGLTRNWNRCLDLAHGPLVQVLLADDTVDSNYLGFVSRQFEQDPTVGFVACSCRYLDGHDRIIHPGRPIASRRYRAGDEAVAALLTAGFPHVSGIVMRRACYETLGKFDERIWHGPDVEMDVRIASRYGFHHFGDVHTSFRRHGSNTGLVNYLRKDYLAADTFMKHTVWSYLSVERRRRLGVTDLDSHISREAVRIALTGAAVTIAYARPDLSWHYICQALERDRNAWRLPQFWKAVSLLAIPKIGQWVMRRRVGITSRDIAFANSVQLSLQAQSGSMGGSLVL